MVELLKDQNERYLKKQREFKAAKLRTQSRRQKNNQIISAELEEQNVSVSSLDRAKLSPLELDENL